MAEINPRLPARPEDVVHLNYVNVRRFAFDFEMSVELFNLLDQLPVDGRLFQYKMIAARNGALSLYHFKYSLSAVKNQLPTSSTHARKVDAASICKALQTFKADFPDIDLVRHAIAHAGELWETPKKMALNRVRSPGHDVPVLPGHVPVIVGLLSQTTYSLAHKGKMVSVEITPESVAKLKVSLQMVVRAFRDAAPNASAAEN
jgi:hypothetical protein